MTLLNLGYSRQVSETPVNRAYDYEQRYFADGWIHRYPKRELADSSVYLLKAWCEEEQRFPFRHPRDSLREPSRRETCPHCDRRNRLAHMEARRAQA